MSETLIYAQGQTATVTAQFTLSPSGAPVDVPDAMFGVYGAGGTEILAPEAMTRVDTGFYYYDWEIPNSLTVGTYTGRITGTVQDVPSAITSYIQILEAGSETPTDDSQRAADIIAALGKYIGQVQTIPVYNELARSNRSRTTFQLTWPRWNLGNHIIRLNQEYLDSTDYTLNLDTGTITFPSALDSSDQVWATYNFKWFTNLQLLGFVSDAVSQINLEPPASTYTIDNYPDTWNGVVMMGASKNAIKSILMSLTLQEPSTVFGGRDNPDRLKEAIELLKTLKENNEKEFTADKKTLKTKGLYPKTSVIVSPIYTMPGGRSRWWRYLFSGGM